MRDSTLDKLYQTLFELETDQASDDVVGHHERRLYSHYLPKPVVKNVKSSFLVCSKFRYAFILLLSIIRYILNQLTDRELISPKQLTLKVTASFFLW